MGMEEEEEEKEGEVEVKRWRRRRRRRESLRRWEGYLCLSAMLPCTCFRNPVRIIIFKKTQCSFESFAKDLSKMNGERIAYRPPKTLLKENSFV